MNFLRGMTGSQPGMQVAKEISGDCSAPAVPAKVRAPASVLPCIARWEPASTTFERGPEPGEGRCERGPTRAVSLMTCVWPCRSKRR
jgi:hypothetical protein